MELDKIINIDCYEFIKTMSDKSIDLIVTDPPYEIVAGGSGGCFGVEHRDYHHEYKTLAVEEEAKDYVNKLNIKWKKQVIREQKIMLKINRDQLGSNRIGK